MIFHRPITEPLQHFSCDIQNTGCWLIDSENIEETSQHPDRPGLNSICITTAAGAGPGVDKKVSRRDPCQEPYTNLSCAELCHTNFPSNNCFVSPLVLQIFVMIDLIGKKLVIHTLHPYT